MSTSSIFIIFTLVSLVIAYYTLKNTVPFIKKYGYLRKHGVLVDALVCAHVANKFTMGTVAAVEYEFHSKKYRSSLLHHAFTPSFPLKYQQHIKVLVDRDNPTQVIAATPLTIISAILGTALVFGFVIFLFILSVSA
jgi:hypothetical protein